MRKFVIGLIAGALLMFSTQAFGAEIKSLIGKKVQGEYTVYVDGKPLDVKAIGTNGSTFTPNRALADAVGYDIKFVDQKVYFTKKAGDGKVPTTGAEVDTGYFTLETIDRAIENTIGDIEAVESSIAHSEMRGNKEAEAAWRGQLVERQAELERLKAIKAQLQSQQ